MDFWPAYFKASLGEPWVIQPEVVNAPQSEIIEPLAPVVFVTKPLSQDSLMLMMEKMVLAIKLSAGDVSFEFSEDLSLSAVSQWESPKKVMVFGSDFQSSFGKVESLGACKVIVTHSLDDLNANPNLKKETWEHLKKFAKL